MTHRAIALRGFSAAALVSGFGCFGAASASADPTDAFAGVLSKGYNSSNCSAQAVSEVQSVFPTVQSILLCGQNSDSSGPSGAKYFLFPNSSDMSSAFTKLVGGDTLTNCGDAKSPTTWHQGSSNDSAGQVACGTDDGKAEVIWTVDAKNVLAFVRASNGDTAALYKWWQANG
ncbi:serine/threonine protein kinase [Mycobacterium vicinigordonae]|uniref:Serine/threonine protein kinase n=1 Tax=Mycobacterium vicinigordonae TaxID=1719132 RepID=A0A7D6E6T7_9MYCO|nr:serine/threonine protein kinase [Mycobacterium vicinigordonae]QLL08103.1 serine/threonine protein kinase [Mycobacterium vicinigordonae]